MILTWNSGARAAGLILFFVLLQNTFFSRIELLGAGVWILPVVALVFGLLGGSLLGASIGFMAGFLSDALGDSPLGLACLVLMAVGYTGGYYREHGGRIRRRSLALLGGIAVTGANLAFGAYGLLAGSEAPVTGGAFLDLVLQALYGAVLALPVFALIYRVLRPALILESPVDERLPDTRAALAGPGGSDEG